MSIPSLAQGRIVALREMTELDAESVVAWRNRPDVRKWLVLWQPLSVAAHLSWFREARKRDVLLMFTTPGGNPMATSAFYGFDRHRTSCEWGRLCGDENGRHPQALLEGAYLAHRLVFDRLGVERTHASCAAENRSAQGLLGFLGYRQEGRRRKHLLTPDGFYDVLEFGMLREDFAVRQPLIEKVLYRGPAAPPELLARGAELRQRFTPNQEIP